METRLPSAEHDWASRLTAHCLSLQSRHERCIRRLPTVATAATAPIRSPLPCLSLPPCLQPTWAMNLSGVMGIGAALAAGAALALHRSCRPLLPPPVAPLAVGPSEAALWHTAAAGIAIELASNQHFPAWGVDLPGKDYKVRQGWGD